MHTGEDLPEVTGGSDKHADALAGHRHDAYRVLRVRLQPHNTQKPSDPESQKP